MNTMDECQSPALQTSVFETSLKETFSNAANKLTQLYVQGLHGSRKARDVGFNHCLGLVLEFAHTQRSLGNESIPVEVLLQFLRQEVVPLGATFSSSVLAEDPLKQVAAPQPNHTQAPIATNTSQSRIGEPLSRGPSQPLMNPQPMSIEPDPAESVTGKNEIFAQALYTPKKRPPVPVSDFYFEFEQIKRLKRMKLSDSEDM